MGSCFGCCSKEDKVSGGQTKRKKYQFPKDSPVFLAMSRKKTVSGVNVHILSCFSLKTKTQIEIIKEHPLIDHKFKRIAVPPFSDFTKITEYLFLTGFWGLYRENIETYKIKCIISTVYEIPKFELRGIECIRLAVEDSLIEDLYIYFDDISDKINANSCNHINTVIHCMAGARRSFTFVIAFLMKYEKKSLRTAFSDVYKKRPISISLNINFIKQLIAYEKKLFGRNSTKLIQYKNHKDLIPDFVPKLFPELLSVEESVEDSIDDTTISVISALDVN